MRFKATTKEGIERKKQRIIVRYIAAHHPEVYAKLNEMATHVVAEDNACPWARVVDFGVGTIHRPSQDLIEAKAQARKERKAFTKMKVED